MRRIAPLLVVLLVAGCGSPPAEQADSSQPAETARPAAEAVAPAVAVPPVAPAVPVPAPAVSALPPAASAPAVAVPAGLEMKLAVDGEGLRLIDSRSGSTRPFAFGLPAATVLAPLERLRGAAGSGRHADCGADYANWADGLSLTFRGGKFAGWALDGRAEGAVATMSGVGPGSTRADLDAAYAATVKPSTLGTEFSAGGLAGLLNGSGPQAKITDMWAGAICLAR